MRGHLLYVILVLVIVAALFGGFGRNWGGGAYYAPGLGGLGGLILLVIILAVLGVI